MRASVFVGVAGFAFGLWVIHFAQRVPGMRKHSLTALGLGIVPMAALTAILGLLEFGSI